MGRVDVLKGIMVLEMRRHHAGLWWHGIFLGLMVAIFLFIVVIVIAATALVLEVGRTLVFVGLAILEYVSLARQ